MKRYLLLILALAGIASAKDWTVNVSYYGNQGFSVQKTDWTGFQTTDTVTYKVDGPGTLFIEDDFGTVYASRTGEVRLAGDQMVGKMMRCSILTPDGELLGWKANEATAAGADTPGEPLVFGGDVPQDGGPSMIVILIALLLH